MKAHGKLTKTNVSSLEIRIPFNASAEIVLMDVTTSDVLLNGQTPDAKQIGNDTIINAGAGHYSIEYSLKSTLEQN